MHVEECFNTFLEELGRYEREIWIQGPVGSSKAYIIASAMKKTNKPALIISSGEEGAEVLAREIETFLEGEEVKLFPSFEIPSPLNGNRNSDLISARSSTLFQILREKKFPPVSLSIQSILQKLSSPEYLKQAIVRIRKGEHKDIREFLEYIDKGGYEFTDDVSRSGEFAKRGSILDIFPIQEDAPVRIEFEDNRVASIRKFSPETQLSTGKLEEVCIMPIDTCGAGATFFSFIPDETMIFFDEPGLAMEKAREILSIIGGEKSSCCFMPFENVIKECKKHMTIYVSTLPQRLQCMQPGKIFRIPTLSTTLSSCSFDDWLKKMRELKENNFRVSLYCNNRGEKNRITELLSDHGIKAGKNPALCIGKLQTGFIFPEIKIAVLSDQEIFNRYSYRPLTKPGKGLPVFQPSELKPGDYVVHINHGTGKFIGLRKIKADGKTREYLTIEYSGGDRIYVAPSHIHLIQKYIGIGGKPPTIYRLGGGLWNLAKERARKAILDMAGELLELCATRHIERGYKFSGDTLWQRELESSFIYDETEDQIKTMQELKDDMEQAKAMDRLICGESGYGKTEIAVRAAFKAVMDGKQVAVLVPTTILAEQHYTTFSERMAEYPVIIAALSRFRSKKEQSEIIEQLKKGSVDILIGTHRLLQADVRFKDLGLLIIDEEQRFGVAQKEKLKQLRKTVDVLTMTATPIPRTLYMSLMGARDISIINTAPKDRVPVEGHIIPMDKKLIRSAVLREIERDGQVFYVHNRIETIREAKDVLEELVPEARIAFAHGQMPEKELSERMSDFVKKRIDVLVCTTIIESGLDIPNANTIIIEQADTYGLADLYQLRGRVGRYKHRAHAFFAVPEFVPTTDGARKRLKAVEEFTGQGSGFRLAMKDLEIRGAGNLLGKEQHGHIQALGFELYSKMLRNTIKEMRGEEEEEFPTTFDIGIEPFIPFNSLTSERNRVIIYRKMFDVTDLKGVKKLKRELNDRFGISEDSMREPLSWLKLRATATGRGISYIGLRGRNIYVRLRDERSFLHPFQKKKNAAELLHEIKNIIEKDYPKPS